MSGQVNQVTASQKIIIWWEGRLYPVFVLVTSAVGLGLLGFFLTDVYDEPDLLQYPYSPYLVPSLWVPLISISIGLLATIISLFHAILAKLLVFRSYWLGLAIFRVILAIFLLVGAVLQSMYMPLPLGSCENQFDWRDLPDGVSRYTPTIFHLLPYRSGRWGTTSGCERLVSIWGLEIAMIVLLLVIFVPPAIFVYLRSAEDFDSGAQESGFSFCGGSRRKAQKDSQAQDTEFQPLNNPADVPVYQHTSYDNTAYSPVYQNPPYQNSPYQSPPAYGNTPYNQNWQAQR